MPTQHLTQQHVTKATCPADKAKVDYFDSRVPGLLLKALRSGRKTYYLRYKDHRGKVKEKRCADASILSLDEARKLAKDKLAQIELGRDPFAEREALKQVPTFAEYIANQYMPYIKDHKRSWNVDEWNLRLHVLPMLGHLHMDEITKQHAIELVHEHRQHPDQYKPSSTNRMISVCRRIFNLALRWDVPGLQKNPMDAVQTFTENNQRKRYLTPEELKRLLTTLDNAKIDMIKPIISMLILTGARKNEVLHARWRDIDLTNCQWTIEDNKSGTTRHVPISDGAVKMLSRMERLEGCGYVFPNVRTGRPYVNIFSSWNTIREEAGLPDVRIHDLRHSFASFLINAGCSIYEVQRILGHSSIRTTQRYAHLRQENLLKASNVVSSLVFQTSLLGLDDEDGHEGLTIDSCA